MWASVNGHVKVVEMLLSKGAQVDLLVSRGGMIRWTREISGREGMRGGCAHGSGVMESHAIWFHILVKILQLSNTSMFRIGHKELE